MCGLGARMSGCDSVSLELLLPEGDGVGQKKAQGALALGCCNALRATVSASRPYRENDVATAVSTILRTLASVSISFAVFWHSVSSSPMT